MTTILDQKEFAKLPRWALVAYMAHCARSFLPRYEDESAEPIDQRTAVTQAIRLAENRAAQGGHFEFTDVIQIEGQFYDNYDIDFLSTALKGLLNTSLNTFSDLEVPIKSDNPASPILTAVYLAKLTFDAAFDEYFSSDIARLAELAEQATVWVLDCEHTFQAQLLRDFEMLLRRSTHENWINETPVPPEVLLNG
jgi:hypothetical protein